MCMDITAEIDEFVTEFGDDSADHVLSFGAGGRRSSVKMKPGGVCHARQPLSHLNM